MIEEKIDWKKKLIHAWTSSNISIYKTRQNYMKSIHKLLETNSFASKVHE